MNPETYNKAKKKNLVSIQGAQLVISRNCCTSRDVKWAPERFRGHVSKQD